VPETRKHPQGLQTCGLDLSCDEVSGEAGPDGVLVEPSLGPLQFAYQPRIGVALLAVPAMPLSQGGENILVVHCVEG